MASGQADYVKGKQHMNSILNKTAMSAVILLASSPAFALDLDGMGDKIMNGGSATHGFYMGFERGMGELSLNGFDTKIAHEEVTSMYEKLRGHGFHDIKAWKFNDGAWERRVYNGPSVDSSRFSYSQTSTGSGSNERFFVGSRLSDNFGIELGMFETESRTTRAKFGSNGLTNLKYDMGLVNPDHLIDGIEKGDIDPQGLYSCVVGYDSIEKYGCAGTTQITTQARGMDVIGSYHFGSYFSLRGGVHKSTVTVAIKQYSSGSVNPSHPDYNNPDGTNRLDSSRVYSGYGFVTGLGFEHPKGLSARFTRHHNLGGQDIHADTISVGYIMKFSSK